VPARFRLGDFPSWRLFDLVASAAAGARVAGICPSALVVRDSVLPVRLTGGPGAGRERALMVTDLDQPAEPVARLVGVDLVPVVALLTELTPDS
jgi:hypothetical protein